VRIQTYYDELERLQIPRDAELCRPGEMTAEDGYRAVGEVLALADPPTAIIAGNNQLFAGLFAAIRDLGLRIPEDLSVVACEETELTALHNPPLDVVLGQEQLQCDLRTAQASCRVDPRRQAKTDCALVDGRRVDPCSAHQRA
jgi:hypothetical protein